jgi:hypothetical protein
MIVRTTGGENVSGRCMSTNDSGLGILVHYRRLQVVPRSVVASVRIRRGRADRLDSVRTLTRGALGFEVWLLATPYGPFDVVLMPGTVA